MTSFTKTLILRPHEVNIFRHNCSFETSQKSCQKKTRKTFSFNFFFHLREFFGRKWRKNIFLSIAKSGKNKFGGYKNKKKRREVEKFQASRGWWMFYKRKIEASLGTIKLFVLDIFATRETQSQKLDDEKKWPLKAFFYSLTKSSCLMNFWNYRDNSNH